MTRLDRHREKQFTTSIIIIAAVLVGSIIFIATAGIKLLFNTSLFIANLNNKNAPATTNSQNNEFIGTISIDSVPTATNSARFIVSGSVVNFDTVDFYLNSKKIKTSSLTNSDSFSEELGDLNPGDNELYVVAQSNSEPGKSKQSKTYTITYKSEKPKLEISSPSDNSKTDKNDITLTGSTDKEIFIKVNDFPVVVDAQGNFQTSIRLKDGDNKIVISATDVAGNVESKTITVTYQKD